MRNALYLWYAIWSETSAVPVKWGGMQRRDISWSLNEAVEGAEYGGGPGIEADLRVKDSGGSPADEWTLPTCARSDV